jgi:hypothetical protein
MLSWRDSDCNSASVLSPYYVFRFLGLRFDVYTSSTLKSTFCVLKRKKKRSMRHVNPKVEIIPLATKFLPVSEPHQSSVRMKGVDPSVFKIPYSDIKSGFCEWRFFCFSLEALFITLVQANTSLHIYQYTHISLPFLFIQLVLSLFYYIEKKKTKALRMNHDQ